MKLASDKKKRLFRARIVDFVVLALVVLFLVFLFSRPDYPTIANPGLSDE